MIFYVPPWGITGGIVRHAGILECTQVCRDEISQVFWALCDIL